MLIKMFLKTLTINILFHNRSICFNTEFFSSIFYLITIQTSCNIKSWKRCLVYPMVLNDLREQTLEFKKHDCKGMASLVDINCRAFQYQAEKFFWKGVFNPYSILNFTHCPGRPPSLLFLLVKLQSFECDCIAFFSFFLT